MSTALKPDWPGLQPLRNGPKMPVIWAASSKSGYASACSERKGSSKGASSATRAGRGSACNGQDPVPRTTTTTSRTCWFVSRATIAGRSRWFSPFQRSKGSALLKKMIGNFFEPRFLFRKTEEQAAIIVVRTLSFNLRQAGRQAGKQQPFLPKCRNPCFYIRLSPCLNLARRLSF